MIRIESNANRIIAIYKERIAQSKDLTVPLVQSAALAVFAAKRRFTSNNWPANAPLTILLKGSSKPGIDTGKGRQSIAADQGSATSIRVGTNLPYMFYLQNGTGLWGPSGQRLRPKSGAALHFGKYFFKSVTGQPPRPFLYFDDPLRTQIRNAFSKWLKGAS
jgi:phage gpG-like protein